MAEQVILGRNPIISGGSDNPKYNQIHLELVLCIKFRVPKLFQNEDQKSQYKLIKNLNFRYSFPHKYADPVKQMKDRELMEKKDSTPKKELKKSKSSYFEEFAKKNKNYPAPNQYTLDTIWAKPINKLASNKACPLKKTFIDDAINQKKKNCCPPIGLYNIVKTEAQVKQQIEEMKRVPKRSQTERNVYIDDCVFGSIGIPGPGNYNPRKILPPLKINSKTPQQMIKRHEELEQIKIKKIQSKSPNVGTYTPQSLVVETFDSIKKKYVFDKGNPENSKNKSKFFGVASRFSEKKNKENVKSVGPGSYDLGINWPGKIQKQDDKDQRKNWFKLISKGVKRSLYY